MAPVACLMLNMGANHHIGPRRINVKLARQLATRGISSIRLDLSGLGDSGPASGSEHFLTQAVYDLQAAMNLIETMLGVRRFIVIGLCSGATNGLSLAVADARVVGLLMFDSYSFPGRRTRLERMIRRAVAAPTNPAFIGKPGAGSSASCPRAQRRRRHRPHLRPRSAGSHRRDLPPLDVPGGSAESRRAPALYRNPARHGPDRDQLGPFANEPFMRHSSTSSSARSTTA